MPPTYSLFGLTLRSDVPLPCPEGGSPPEGAHVELVESTGDQLEELCIGAPASIEDDGFWRCMLHHNGAASVRWKDHFEFVVSGDGRRVLWRRLVAVPDEVLFTYLLGQVLSFCLLLRGLEPLHAAGVMVNGSAIAFLGDSGEGKSTLAAALVERGHRLLTDDVLVVQFDGSRALAHPSLARIKLTPESADAVFRGRRSVPMNRFTRKMIFPVRADQHVPCLVPLRAAYVMRSESEDSSVSIGRLEGRAGFFSVIRHTFNDSVLDAPRIRQQFAFARHLVDAVTVKTLSFPRQLAVLPELADAVLADAHEGDDR